MNYELR